VNNSPRPSANSTKRPSQCFGEGGRAVADSPLTPTDVDALAARVAELLAERLAPRALVPQTGVPTFLGISRSAFFRLKATTGFPRAVHVEGAGVHYRRAELLAWAERLKPARRRPRRQPAPAP
jgi:predicted DNA-binding transcriptional regulator AlpA